MYIINIINTMALIFVIEVLIIYNKLQIICTFSILLQAPTTKTINN